MCLYWQLFFASNRLSSASSSWENSLDLLREHDITSLSRFFNLSLTVTKFHVAQMAKYKPAYALIPSI